MSTLYSDRFINIIQFRLDIYLKSKEG